MMNASSTDLVSIIISNYNGKNHLQECLASLMRLNYANYEVIVVDAGSTDGAPEMVRKEFPTCQLVTKGNIGIGEAINCGLKVANGNFIVFDLNNDDVVDPDWLTPQIQILKDSQNVGVVCGKRFCYRSNEILDSMGGTINYLTGDVPAIGQLRLDSEEFSHKREVDYTPVIATRRDVIEKVGVCDETYFIYFEDADFCLRAKKVGYKIVCEPTAKFWHKGSSTIGKCSYRSYYYLCRNQLRFVLKLYPIPYIASTLSYIFFFKLPLDSFLMIKPFRRLLSKLFPRYNGYLMSRSDPKLLKAQISAIVWALRNTRITIKDRYALSNI